MRRLHLQLCAICRCIVQQLLAAQYCVRAVCRYCLSTILSTVMHAVPSAAAAARAPCRRAAILPPPLPPPQQRRRCVALLAPQSAVTAILRRASPCRRALTAHLFAICAVVPDLLPLSRCCYFLQLILLAIAPFAVLRSSSTPPPQYLCAGIWQQSIYLSIAPLSLPFAAPSCRRPPCCRRALIYCSISPAAPQRRAPSSRAPSALQPLQV